MIFNLCHRVYRYLEHTLNKRVSSANESHGRAGVKQAHVKHSDEGNEQSVSVVSLLLTAITPRL